MKKREDEDDEIDEEGFEMVQNNMYANPLADLEAAKAAAKREQLRNKQLQEANAQGSKQRSAMMEQMKRLKQNNQRQLVSLKIGTKSAGRMKGKKREMAQQRVKT